MQVTLAAAPGSYRPRTETCLGKITQPKNSSGWKTLKVLFTYKLLGYYLTTITLPAPANSSMLLLEAYEVFSRWSACKPINNNQIDRFFWIQSHYDLKEFGK